MLLLFLSVVSVVDVKVDSTEINRIEGELVDSLYPSEYMEYLIYGD